MCIKITELPELQMLLVSELHSNLSRYSVNEKINKMGTVVLNTIICCFH